MKRLLIALLVPVCIMGCTSSSKISSTNLSFIYKPRSTTLHPQYFVYHVNDSISQIHFRIRTEELLYSKKENDKAFQAKVQLRYKLMDSFESTVIRDSSTSVIIDISSDKENRVIIGYIDFKTPALKKYLLEIEAVDVYRDMPNVTYLEVDKSNKFGRQNYLLKSAETGMPVFRNNVYSEDSMIIVCNNPKARKLMCRYYDRDFPLAPPPFSLYTQKPFVYKADSLFDLSIVNSEATIRFNKKGLYHIQTDTINKNRLGITVFNFGNHYPEIRSTEQMVPALRYITTKKEYTALTEADNPKEGLDEFWLRNSANAERAKELIRHYYSRVQFANNYFTSYVEGWRTDRGMVYVVFGPPNVVYKNSDSESWVYGEENNFMSLNFTFVNVDNPFSGNDYSMSRTPIYKSNWIRAVDSWRQGRVFSNN